MGTTFDIFRQSGNILFAKLIFINAVSESNIENLIDLILSAHVIHILASFIFKIVNYRKYISFISDAIVKLKVLGVVKFSKKSVYIILQVGSSLTIFVAALTKYELKSLVVILLVICREFGLLLLMIFHMACCGLLCDTIKLSWAPFYFFGVLVCKGIYKL